MPIREFRDSTGTTWRVWGMVPRASGVYDESLRAGWLTFENASGARRRLAPIPRGWEDVPQDRLELMCRAADPVARPSGSTARQEDPDAPDEAGGPAAS